MLLSVMYEAHPDWRGTLVGKYFEDPLVTVQFTSDAIIVWHPEGADISAMVAQARALEAGSGR